jgi:hypothetical protein
MSDALRVRAVAVRYKNDAFEIAAAAAACVPDKRTVFARDRSGRFDPESIRLGAVKSQRYGDIDRICEIEL